MVLPLNVETGNWKLETGKPGIFEALDQHYLSRGF